MIIIGEQTEFDDPALGAILMGVSHTAEDELLAEAAEEKKGEKKEYEDAISEAKKAVAELVSGGKPGAARPGERADSARVSATHSERKGSLFAALSFSLRTESEKAKSRFENVKGLYPKAVRDVAYDRRVGGGQMHYSARAGSNVRVSFRFVPGHPTGTYGCTVLARAKTPQKAKQYLAILISGLPGWAKAEYAESLRHKHESTGVEFFGEAAAPEGEEPGGPGEPL